MIDIITKKYKFSLTKTLLLISFRFIRLLNTYFIGQFFLLQLFSKIFQHLSHFFPLALFTLISISPLSDSFFSAFETIKYSAKSKLLNNSNFSFLALILISASKLEPISLLILFSSIAIFASCLILNNSDHLRFNVSFFQLEGIFTKSFS